AALRTRCELVFMNEPQGRGVKAGYGRAEDDLSFADGAPVLLTSEESLDALNGKLEAPVEMTRFRPNLVARVGEAFAEDRWRHVRVGHAAFDVEWPCSRCPVPTVDPETGIRDGNREPLRTLSEFRSTSNGAMFGQNLIPRKLGRVRVGDRIEVVESVGS
ncbi:MAG TPA: MOSC domain-containing protein, partial [Gammaproteobacteria bacterium]